MDAETQEILRKPFPPDVVGKLPRVWCGACRDATKAARRQAACQQHEVQRCNGCRNKITDAHLHLDYVGHAETTDRFLQADPEWTWEPLAFGPDGLPAYDQHGGLWIWLTIAGTRRLGYGAAQGKEGPDAVKEIIGDALRNGGMRFGVALDLWGAKFKEASETDQEPAAERENWDDAKPAAVPNGAQVEWFNGLLAGIKASKSPKDITAMARQSKAALRDGSITAVQNDHLAKEGAKRLAEIEQEASGG